MSKLEELIAELCPDGVKYKELWEVTIWDKRFNAVDNNKQPRIIKYPSLLAKDLFALEQKDGDVFLLSTGEQTGWTTEAVAGDKLCKGEVVSIPWGKSRAVKDVMKYYKGKFVTADNRIATSSDVDTLLNKYLYYWMMTQSDIIDSFYRGSGLKHPSMKDVLDMKIPVPPIEVQNEIVRILDNFTELTAELTARKKQYEYYRKELLTFADDVKKVPLIDVVKIKRGVRVVKSQLAVEGEYPVFQNSMTPLGYMDKANCTGDTAFIITAGAAGEIGYTDNDFWAADDCFSFECPQYLKSKYLYYILLCQKNTIYSKVRKASIPRLPRSAIEKLIIPVPNVDIQEKIVDVLDRFDTLCNDISKGLPAEIEARQKQYEYYRDKLLTFKESSDEN